MPRRTVLALSTGALVLGGLAAPALASPAAVEDEQVCVITRYEPEKGNRDGICVWFPKVIPDLP